MNKVIFKYEFEVSDPVKILNVSIQQLNMYGIKLMDNFLPQGLFISDSSHLEGHHLAYTLVTYARNIKSIIHSLLFFTFQNPCFSQAAAEWTINYLLL